jgi:hypothetical protein
MSLYVDPPFALGQTLGVSNGTDGESWLGTVKLFPDVDPTTGKVRSGKLKKCIAVRNVSGQVLRAKRAVAWKNGTTSLGNVANYREVSGYSRLTNDAVAGIVDEFIPSSGVANNDIFWVTVEGPTELLVGQTVAVGDTVAAVTAHTTNATDSAGTGGYGATVSVTVAPQVGVLGRVVSGTTNNVAIIARVVEI